MQKIEFKNLPDTSTPLNASTLNQMQDNIENAIPSVETSYSTSSTNPYSALYSNSIVESGSNANGEYLKFANGMLIQFGQVNISANSDQKTVTLPTEFYDTNYRAYFQNIYANRMNVFWCRATRTKTTMTVYCSTINMGVPDYGTVADYMLVGRWK